MSIFARPSRLTSTGLTPSRLTPTRLAPVRVALCAAITAGLAFSATTAVAQETPTTTTPTAVATAQGMVAAGSDKLVSTNVTLGEGQANWDWVRSFREYVGLHRETRTGVELDQFNNSLLWSAAPGQHVDVENLQTLKFTGRVHWTHHGGQLDVSMANPTIDFVNKRLLVDGTTVGTLANPGVAVDKKQVTMLELPDLKAEVKDGYLLVTSFAPRITHFSHELVGFYEGETREPFVATIKINDVAGERPAPILWQLFPDKYDALRPKNIQPDDPDFVDAEVPVDPALAKCIIWELDLKPQATIMKSHLVKLRTLGCNGINTPEAEKIRSLEGLQYAKRLTRVNLRQQRLADLSPLRDHPTIHELDISENNLSEINGLGYMPKLTNLKAEKNQLINVDQLVTQSSLESLNLSHNKLFHLSWLPHDKGNLRKLYVAGNEIEDISPLEHYKYLKVVDLSNNAITRVDALGTIRGVEEINLSNNFIEDITPLHKLNNFDNLKKLFLANNRITNREDINEFGRKVRDVPADRDIAHNDRVKPSEKTAPAISSQPASVETQNGKAATFTVAATGNPAPAVQWQRKIGADWVNLPGANETTLTVTAGADGADNGTEYRAVVRNAVTTVFSDAATLTITAPPAAPSTTSSSTPSATPSATLPTTPSTKSSVAPTSSSAEPTSTAPTNTESTSTESASAEPSSTEPSSTAPTSEPTSTSTVEPTTSSVAPTSSSAEPTSTASSSATPTSEPVPTTEPTSTSKPAPSGSSESGQSSVPSGRVVVGIVATVLTLLGGIAAAMNLPGFIALIAQLFRL